MAALQRLSQSMQGLSTTRAMALPWYAMIPSMVPASLNLLSSLQPPSLALGLPSILSEIWDGILKAVPKKKTSHMKKRHRQLAGKALKDVKSLVKCPVCGRPKKSHTLCPFCVAGLFTCSVRLGHSTADLLIDIQEGFKRTTMKPGR